jgi:hypothetical protein
MNKLDIFHKRLKKIGIDITMFGNYPWVYIDTILEKTVTERFHGNHGFTVYWSSTNEFTDLKEIFKLIRKYSGRKKV